MGRLILTMHVSADGYIATPDGGLWPGFGWPPEVQGRLNEVYRQAGLAIYGRAIYEAVVPWWLSVARGEPPDGTDVGAEGEEFARLLAGLPKVVVSTTLPQPGGGVQVIRDDVVRHLAGLIEAQRSDVVLLAGGRLSGDLLGSGLLTEVVLIVGTVLLGAGRPLFDGLATQRQLELLETEAFPPSTSWLRYRVLPPAPRA